MRKLRFTEVKCLDQGHVALWGPCPPCCPHSCLVWLRHCGWAWMHLGWRRQARLQDSSMKPGSRASHRKKRNSVSLWPARLRPLWQEAEGVLRWPGERRLRGQWRHGWEEWSQWVAWWWRIIETDTESNRKN